MYLLGAGHEPGPTGETRLEFHGRYQGPRESWAERPGRWKLPGQRVLLALQLLRRACRQRDGLARILEIKLGRS